jgi:hypothetical protein
LDLVELVAPDEDLHACVALFEELDPVVHLWVLPSQETVISDPSRLASSTS